ncbi:hypothetical protein N9350_02065 [Gammaproteobacteria bacterium]|nr:hypothetical protein [Gammaproteobacteria bacterium]
MSSFIDIASFAFVLANVRSISRAQLIILCLSIPVILYSFSVVIIDAKNLVDYLLIIKPIVYLSLLNCLDFKSDIGKRGFMSFVKIILFLFFVKYLFSVILGLNIRPLLLRENNFELMFIFPLYSIFLFSPLKLGKVFHFFVLGVVALSGSKSGLIIYLFLGSLYVIYSFGIKPRGMAIISMIAILVMIGLMIILPSSLLLEIKLIDRFAMAVVSWQEFQDFSLIEWVLGKPFITPLMASSCSALYYYPGLFSHAGDGSCYSVILHMFNFRAIYDYGLLGLLLIWLGVYHIFVRILMDRRMSIIITLTFMLNGFSVSSINSSFFLLTVIVLYIFKKDVRFNHA